MKQRLIVVLNLSLISCLVIMGFNVIAKQYDFTTRLASYPKVIKPLGLSEAENKKIFADNARRILNLS